MGELPTVALVTWTVTDLLGKFGKPKVSVGPLCVQQALLREVNQAIYGPSFKQMVYYTQGPRAEFWFNEFT